MKKPIALITGSSRGIGKAIALALAKDGFDIWLHFNTNKQLAENVLNEITKLGGNGKLIQMDLGNSDEIHNCIGPLIKEESPEVYVHNAGILTEGSIAFISSSQVKNTLAVNLESFFHVVKLLSRKMIQTRRGKIISISSIAAIKGIPGQACYSASKAGLIAATYAVARELGPYGITVNTVVPGLIETAMSCNHREQVLDLIPIRRAGQPEEVANLISFLCSDKSSYINGSVIPITGGI